MITIFNFFDYAKNPIVEYCLSHKKDKQVLTLDDCMDDIMKLRHSRFCYENNLRVRIGNELRLYYASISDDFTYCDADCLVENESELKMNHCFGVKGQFYNDGSYFRANRDTDWVKYYLDVYENNHIGDVGTHKVYMGFRHNIPTQIINHTHFYVGCFNRFPKMDKIYYTNSKERALQFDKPVWLFDGITGRVTNCRIYHTTEKLPLDVFKEQLIYSQGKQVEFEEI